MLLSSAAVFFGLSRLPTLGPDEPRYAEVAREMVASGDYISPKLNGCLWLEKPALLYWMDAVSYRMFGVNEQSARLPVALAATLTVLFLFFAVGRTTSWRLGFLCGLVLVTCPMFMAFGRAAVTDMPLTFATCAALLSIHLAQVRQGSGSRFYWVLGWAMAGVAMLAKGLVGILLFVSIGGLAEIASREPSQSDMETRARPRLARRPIWLVIGALASAAVAAVWYLPMTLRYGGMFINEFFINQHFKRYLTNQYHHPEPAYFYVVVVFVGVLPWTFYLAPACQSLRRLLAGLPRRPPAEPGAESGQGKPPRPDRYTSAQLARRHLEWLAWAWLLIPLLFFSFSQSKLPGYILPSLPALGIIIAIEIERLWMRPHRVATRAASVLAIAFQIALGIGLAAYLRLRHTTSGWGLEYVPFLLAGASLAAHLTRRFLWSTGLAAASLPAALCAGLLLLAPSVSYQIGLKDLSLQTAANLRPGEKIAFFVDREYAPVFYSGGRVLCGGEYGDTLNALSTDTIVGALRGRPSLVVITELNWLPALQKDKRLAIEIIGRQRDEVSLRVTQSGSL